MDIDQLLALPDWPKAVDESTICDETSESEKLDRAQGIVSVMIQEDLFGKKFLDFGCGEGHTIEIVNSLGGDAIGYDIKKFNDKINLTTYWPDIVSEGPYDIILLYDVMDHADDPVNVLEKCKSVLAPKGKIYCRFHPICSRHGGHLYRQINKAFVHLIMSSEELKIRELVIPPQRALFPIATYRDWCKKANVKIVKEDIEHQQVEDFFKNNMDIKKRLFAFYGRQMNEPFPEFQLSQCFLDFQIA